MAHSKEHEKLISYSRKAGVPLWKVAEKVGVSDFTFSRYMRHLTKEQCEHYMHIIDQIKAGEEYD